MEISRTARCQHCGRTRHRIGQIRCVVCGEPLTFEEEHVLDPGGTKHQAAWDRAHRAYRLVDIPWLHIRFYAGEAVDVLVFGQTIFSHVPPAVFTAWFLTNREKLDRVWRSLQDSSGPVDQPAE